MQPAAGSVAKGDVVEVTEKAEVYDARPRVQGSRPEDVPSFADNAATTSYIIPDGDRVIAAAAFREFGLQVESYPEDGFLYAAHANAGGGRAFTVAGPLTGIYTHERDRDVQQAAGGDERRPADDGMHLLAGFLGGSNEWYNVAAGAGALNKGEYAAMERSWKQELGAGSKVFVSVSALYEDGSRQRPSHFLAAWQINDGEWQKRLFHNG